MRLSNVEIMPPRDGHVAPNQALLAALKNEGLVGVLIAAVYEDGEVEVTWSSLDIPSLAELGLKAHAAVSSL